MSQIKWLTRIEVIDRRYEGRHMARNYQSLRALKSREGTVWLDTSISRNNLKSVIARITRRRSGERFEYRIAGAAWGGPAKIVRVQVQIDGGSWVEATIDRQGPEPAWLLWSIVDAGIKRQHFRRFCVQIWGSGCTRDLFLGEIGSPENRQSAGGSSVFKEPAIGQDAVPTL